MKESCDNSNIKIYTLDTLESVIDRMAMYMGTIPQHVYFKIKNPTLEDIKNKKLTAYNRLYKIHDTLIVDLLKNGEYTDEQLHYFIVNNKKYTGRDTTLAIMVDQDEFNSRNINITTVLQNKHNIITDMNKKINDNRNSVINLENSYKLFEKQKLKKSESFIVDKTDIDIYFRFQHETTLLDVFNMLKLDINIPFASVNGSIKL